MVRRLPLSEHPILLVIGPGILVASQFHLLELSGLPPVHFERPNKGDMYPHSSVVSGTLVAQENSNRSAAPFWVFGSAIEADLKE